jgi:hypothetical protein
VHPIWTIPAVKRIYAANDEIRIVVDDGVVVMVFEE